MSDWQRKPTNIKNYKGFVYIIVNEKNDKYYIGQKVFWNKRKLKPLKGKKRFRYATVESDWKDYWGSSKELLNDVEKYGKENFSRIILVWCKSKAGMNYLETKKQFKFDVLRDPKSYNGMINCRISKNQINPNHL